MNSTDAGVTTFIHIELVAADFPAADLSIRLEPAPEKPVPGAVSKQSGEVFMVRESSGKMVAMVSLGKKEKISSDVYRQAGGGLARWLTKSGILMADLDLDPIITIGQAETEALMEGIYLGAYQFNRHKKIEDLPQVIKIHVRSNLPAAQEWIDRISKIAGAVYLTRDWAHEPANIINPITLSERVRAMAEQDGLKVTVLDENELAGMGAGGILNVGKGSATPPRMIILEYPGTGTGVEEKPIILIGKALTFDSGGYSLKNSESIQTMKYDKCGGVTVAAVLHLASQLKFKTPIVGIIGAAENMVSAQAYRPDDILEMLSGKTVEIISTDAEGRLVLADALAYAQNKYQPRAMIDLATLTGGVVVALGHVRAGMMANDDDLANQLYAAGEKTYERLWRLPLDEEFIKLIKGDDADIKNSGGREGHAIIGGIFLQQFVKDDVPWAHLDIAGVADTSKELPYSPKGATGFGVRLLAEYLSKI